MVNSHKKPISCCYCGEHFKARELERHLYAHHTDPNKYTCPWCHNISWNPRKKYQHAKHLSNCFKRYSKLFQWTSKPKANSRPEAKSPAPEARNNSRTIQNPLYYDPKPNCETRHFYGREKLENLHPYAYEDVFKPPVSGDGWFKYEDDNKLRFVECNDSAIEYIRKFLQWKESKVGWFHLIVKAFAINKFFDCFEKYVDPKDDSKRNSAFLLEYSCWCDGGKRKDNLAHQHHRHMIAVARNGNHFKIHCWNKVIIPNPPVKRYKLCNKIQSWKHLQNALFYVSSRKSMSDQSRKGKKDIGTNCDEWSHFYIFKPVTLNFKLCVALSVEGGIQEWITSIVGQKKVTPFAPFCVLKNRDGNLVYAIRIKDVPNIEHDWMHSVIPVKKKWVPTGMMDRNKSVAYFNVMNKFRMHFEWREDLEMQDQEWAEMQARKGNVFLESVKNDFWFPPRNQQRLLNEVVPLVRNVRNMELRLEKQKRNGQYQSLRDKSDYVIRLARQKVDFENQLERQKGDFENRLEKQKKDFENQIQMNHLEKKNLKDNFEKLYKIHLKRESNLKFELKKEIDSHKLELEREKTELKKEIDYHKTALKKEIDYHKTELEREKTRYDSLMENNNEKTRIIIENLTNEKEEYKREIQRLRQERRHNVH